VSKYSIILPAHLSLLSDHFPKTLATEHCISNLTISHKDESS